jgi:peroxiredoxin
LNELEREFARLADEIPASPEQRAISVLHGIVMEIWRDIERERPPLAERGLTLEGLLDLCQTAPPLESKAVNTPLEPGTEAPDFALPDASGQPIRLSDTHGQPVVVVFYPFDWGPTCTQQLDLYHQEIDEFRRRGAELLAISVDSIYSHCAWTAVRGMSFPLLADFNPKGEVARRYSVWREQDGCSERALYVIDPDGIIRYSHVSPYLHHVPTVQELLDAVDAAQATAA